MKKIFLFVALLLSQVASIQAFDVEARVAYYLPINRHITRAYGVHGFPEYEVEASMPLNSIASFCGLPCDNGWAAWTNFSIFHRKGHDKRRFSTEVPVEPQLVDSDSFSSSSCSRFRTQITNWTLNFGLKKYLGACCFPAYFRPYIGFGIGYANAHFKGHFDRFGNGKSCNSGFAFLVKTGVEYDIACNIYLNGFADYASNYFDSSKSHCRKSPRFNTGGLKIGLGIGYHF